MNIIFNLLGEITAPLGSGSTKRDALNIVLQMLTDFKKGIPLYEISYLFFVTDTGSYPLCVPFPTTVQSTWLTDWRTVGPPSGTISMTCQSSRDVST
jgi:hypothetical protein